MNVANASTAPEDETSTNMHKTTTENPGEQIVLEHWSESTHKDLYLSSSSVIDKIVSLLVLFSQFLIYFAIMHYSNPDYDEVTVKVDTHYCYDDVHTIEDGNTTHTVNIEDIVENAYCGDLFGESEEETLIYIVTWIIMFMYLTSDIFLSVKTLFDLKSKSLLSCKAIIISIIIIIDSIVSWLATIAYINGLGREKSAYDFFLGPVAVAFVHDMDEQANKAIKNAKNSLKICYVILFIIFVLFAIGLESRV